jgi:transcriptional regulator with XRE-family HTH domain
MAFGSDIKRLRTSSGYTVRGLADAIGINADRLKQWEIKDLDPKIDDRQLIEIFFERKLLEIQALSEIPDNIKEKIVPLRDIPKQKNKKHNKGEAIQVPFEDFMEVKYLPAYVQAGYLNEYAQVDGAADENLDTVLVPKEFEKGNYMVVEVNGDSMDDDSKKAICAGDKLLIKELDIEFWHNQKLHYRNNLFVLMTRNEGVVVKQIIKHDVPKGIISCHSWNPAFKDFDVLVKDVYRLFYVKKIVERRINF